MNQTVTVSPKTMQAILERLDILTKEVKTIKAKLFKKEPPYGSDEWWEKETEEGLKDLREKRIYGPFPSAKNLITSLHKESANI